MSVSALIRASFLIAAGTAIAACASDGGPSTAIDNRSDTGFVVQGNPESASGARANVFRAHMTHELLRCLSYVDMSRVAHHGHSLGAYVGVATIAAYPADYRVASHTGGGVRPRSSSPARHPPSLRLPRFTFRSITSSWCTPAPTIWRSVQAPLRCR